MHHFGDAWNVMARNLVGWLLLVLAAWGVAIISFGLWGLFFGPNIYLVVKRSLERDTGPDIADLFDTEHVFDYFIYVIIMMGVGFVNGMVSSFCICFLVFTIPFGLLFPLLMFWVPMLLADGAMGASDAIRTSARAVMGSWVDPLVFAVMGILIEFVAAIPCGLGLLFAVPVVTIASWLYYQAEKDRILAA